MAMRQNWRYRERDSREPSPTVRLAKGLGWFSVGLGLAEVAAPGALAHLIGVRSRPQTRTLLRAYGLRELAAGVGILTQSRQETWIWARVAGDALDLATLAWALGSSHTSRWKAGAATAAVVGVTALDVMCGQELSSQADRSSTGGAATVIETIIVNATPEEAYRFWHNLENLPRFMTYLESVRVTGDRRTHWTAKGPADRKIEWDAETLTDEPNRIIAWRSLAGTAFGNSGSVRFEEAPGNRGTLVRVEMQYAPLGGSLASTLTKVLGMDVGRRIRHDLRNFKQVLEIGEVTRSDASIHSGMHAAQPPEEYEVPVLDQRQPQGVEI